MMNKIGFVGAGKMGVSLGHYLKNNGLCVTGFYDSVSEAARFASELTETVHFANLNALLEACEVVFVTVPDGVIAAVWDSCRQYDIRGKYFFHCSGALGSDVFSGSEEAGVQACSVHPVCAVGSQNDCDVFFGKFFVGEGDETGLKLLKSMLERTNNPFRMIRNADKAKYHAAAVVSSNLFCALAQMGEDLLHECGFDPTAAHELLSPLMLGNMDNIAEKGCVPALTGPVERNDAGTVAKHLSVLEHRDREVYRLLTLRLIDMAQQKHRDRDYTNLLKMLEK